MIPQPYPEDREAHIVLPQHSGEPASLHVLRRIHPVTRTNWNKLELLDIINALMASANDKLPGILRAFETEKEFKLIINPFPMNPMTIKAHPVLDAGWTNEYGIRRIVEVEINVIQMITILMGDNGYPISVTLGSVTHPVLERQGSTFHVNATNKPLVISVSEQMIRNNDLTAYIKSAREGKNLLGESVERVVKEIKALEKQSE